MIDDKALAKWILLKETKVGREAEEVKVEKKEEKDFSELGKVLSELKEKIEALSSFEEKKTGEILAKEDRLLAGEERIEKEVGESHDELIEIEERLKHIEEYYEELKKKGEHKGLIKAIGEKIARLKELLFKKKIERAEKELIAREELGKPEFVKKAEKTRPVEEKIKPMVRHRLLLPPPAPPIEMKREKEFGALPLLPPPPPKPKKKKGFFAKLFGK